MNDLLRTQTILPGNIDFFAEGITDPEKYFSETYLRYADMQRALEIQDEAIRDNKGGLGQRYEAMRMARDRFQGLSEEDSVERRLQVAKEYQDAVMQYNEAAQALVAKQNLAYEGFKTDSIEAYISSLESAASAADETASAVQTFRKEFENTTDTATQKSAEELEA